MELNNKGYFSNLSQKKKKKLGLVSEETRSTYIFRLPLCQPSKTLISFNEIPKLQQKFQLS